jgi:5-oxoprolinase (ATP-hydrolysing)
MTLKASDRWQFWIDVGGTFTDCVSVRQNGSWRQRKVLSSAIVKGTGQLKRETTLVDPGRHEPPGFWRGALLEVVDDLGKVAAVGVIADSLPGEIQLAAPIAVSGNEPFRYELNPDMEAPLLAIHLELALPLQEPIPPCDVRLGTTRGTNALLTRRGAKVGLITTRGFADLWAIGYQNRPRLFDLTIRKPPGFYAATAEVDERVIADGRILRPLDEASARRLLTELKNQGIESLAICLLHAYRNPAHEQTLGKIASELGFAHVSLSHAVSATIKAVPRGDTTLVSAYLNPVLQQYIDRIVRQLPGSDLRLMTSSGGLVSPEAFEGHQSVLSGPAGGVVGFARVAEACRNEESACFGSAIGFDMGGTSTDVARYAGEFTRQYEVEKAGVRIVSLMLAIETIAAGGGSICSFDGTMLTVGPQSAGANPGPACYGRDGPLTVTDLNLFLGRLLPQRFPFVLNRDAVEQRLSELADTVATTGRRYELAELAAGLLKIANAQMAGAIRSISIAKGYDPRESALVPFGAAGPQHACAVADELGMTTIVSHPSAGVLSAVGIGLSDTVRHGAQHIGLIDSESARRQVSQVLDDLAGESMASLRREGFDASQIIVHRRVDVRYQGTEHPLTVAANDLSTGDFFKQFVQEHHRLYGYVRNDRAVEIVTARVEAIGQSRGTLPTATSTTTQTKATPIGSQPMCSAEGWTEASVYERSKLVPGDTIAGPAVIGEELSTTIIEAGWTAEVWTGGVMVLRRTKESAKIEATTGVTDPIELQLFSQRFAAIAEQMGIALRNTATSVNVRERLDFSCALFTASGDLVANAPHVPVHLGAMGETVKAVLADNPDLSLGDVVVTNDPFRGGSHLPDITVVTPVFGVSGGKSPELRFFVANRAHHAEIGGITPGSMPPRSRTLADEGVLIRNFKLFVNGEARYDALAQLLKSGPWPSRNVADNLADISAQVAANRQGETALAHLIAEYSWSKVAAAMRDIQLAAEEKTRQALAKLVPGERHFVDHLDDGSTIAVTLTIATDAAKPLVVDFAGTSPVLTGNLNANRAIVTSAVLYVLRCLLAEEIPLNQGVLAPVEIRLPECMLNPPVHPDPKDCAAVVGGNVETSQRVVDVLLGAFGIAAASQGTMNNFLFGDASFGYYETICGGAGATADGPGADAVHTHMTNTRITDPEVLESRFPVRVKQFAIRRGSGGRGKHAGGNGVVREIEFLKPVTVSLVTQRRGDFAPYGISEGECGAKGKNVLIRADGSQTELPGIAEVQIAAGDSIRIETPGGGGWGKPAT